MNILVPSIPKRLTITSTMVDDFMIDPVLGAKVIFGINLDVFQKVRLRLCWWTPNFMDHSGFGTGKDFVAAWLFANLRAILFPIPQKIMVLYQSFGSGKDIFWPEYEVQAMRGSAIFNAQCGRVEMLATEDGKDKKASQERPECWIWNYRNGAQVMMPAPGWLQDATTQAGKTIHVAIISEWTKIESLGKKTSAGTIDTLSGIDQQIIGRLRGGTFNQFHPLWGNKLVLEATAESPRHPGWRRYQTFRRKVESGDMNYALYTSCFKDFSNLPSYRNGPEDTRPFKVAVPNWNTINTMRASFTKAHTLREIYGLWQRDTKGWYSETALESCIQAGQNLGLRPEAQRGAVEQTSNIKHQTSNPGIIDAVAGLAGNPRVTNPAFKANELFYFLGVDPAPAQGTKSDDGAMVCLRARPRAPGQLSANLSDWWLEYVWAYRLRGADVRQWSGFIHRKHQHFGFSGLLMDPGGGGQFIMLELAKNRQLIQGVEQMVQPICSFEDMTNPGGQFILNLFKRGDRGIEHLWPVGLRNDSNLVDNMHVVMQEAVEHHLVALPAPFNETPRAVTEQWSEEDQWSAKILDQMGRQLLNIDVATRDDGTWVTNIYGARLFSAQGKKDVAYAGIYAYVRFLIWLKMGEEEFAHRGDDAAMCYT